ncbi:MAG TPA: uracil-DNA glycosylase [Patescibacteria group bacterium]|nr:uracil-DNA glycosylase [Patescibacteria group bacterium]
MPKQSKNDKELTEVAKEIANCAECKAGKGGMPVPGEGNSSAQVVFLGEAPGKIEARTGRPFVGSSGKLLRKLIAEAGLKEDKVFITSPVKYLPSYVTPTPEDVAHGRTHLEKQLAIIKPKIIVLLGRVAALAMLKSHVPVAQRHGEIIKEKRYSFFLTYHPAAALYNPKLKSELSKDFKKIKRLIKARA